MTSREKENMPFERLFRHKESYLTSKRINEKSFLNSLKIVFEKFYEESSTANGLGLTKNPSLEVGLTFIVDHQMLQTLAGRKQLHLEDILYLAKTIDEFIHPVSEKDRPLYLKFKAETAAAVDQYYEVRNAYFALKTRESHGQVVEKETV